MALWTNLIVSMSAALALGACASEADEPIDDMEQPRLAELRVSVTHHATPQAGSFPDLGSEERSFETDQGYAITLADGWLTLTSIALITCDAGASTELTVTATPHDLRAPDGEPVEVGWGDVAEGSYCSFVLAYGPGKGQTATVSGTADKDGVTHDFSLQSTEPLITWASAMNGAPIEVDSEGIDLTVGVAYDRIFDCTNFVALDGSAQSDTLFEAQVLGMVAEESRVFVTGSVPVYAP